jgi:hypothetical protein
MGETHHKRGVTLDCDGFRPSVPSITEKRMIPAARTIGSIAAKCLYACLALLAAGCASYTTPGAGVNLQNLSKADASIADLMKIEPAAPFRARVSVVRVQSSGYSSRSNTCYGSGQFCVVTTRDIEPEASFDRLSKMPQVAALALMNRMLLPAKLSSTMDLRRAAATLKTDLLLMYSMDTGFNVESTDIGPLQTSQFDGWSAA